MLCSKLHHSITLKLILSYIGKGYHRGRFFLLRLQVFLHTPRVGLYVSSKARAVIETSQCGLSLKENIQGENKATVRDSVVSYKITLDSYIFHSFSNRMTIHLSFFKKARDTGIVLLMIDPIHKGLLFHS